MSPRRRKGVKYRIEPFQAIRSFETKPGIRNFPDIRISVGSVDLLPNRIRNGGADRTEGDSCRTTIAKRPRVR
jgi:hypothetical protein